MNVLLWVLQGLLALWSLVGGIYTFSNFEKLKGGLGESLPRPLWLALSVLQILFALALVVPRLSPAAAIYLALYSLFGCAVFSAYAGFPGLLWGVLPAVLFAFVAYGRLVLRPFS